MRKLLIALMLMPLLAMARTETANGIKWRYDIENEILAQVYSVSLCDEVCAVSGVITIPSMLGGCPVTRIKRGGRNFEFCNMTSVIIPSSVAKIENEAFSHSRLTSFVVDKANRKYSSRNGLLCTKDGKTLLAGVNGDVTIPSGVTNVEAYAFSGCEGLKSVVIPSTVTVIGNGAFNGCEGLASVVIPSSVTTIGNSAFNSCKGLKSVTIPPSVTMIGDGAFHNCGGMMSFKVDEANANYSSRNGLLCTKDGRTLLAGVNGEVTIPPGVTNIVDYAFISRLGLKSVTIPLGVTNIGTHTFAWCSGLESVTIPSSVRTIEHSAFHNCSGLKSVTIPSSVTTIGNGAFCDCSGLKSVTIPSSVTLLEDSAFLRCYGLTSVTIPSGLRSYVLGAFENCPIKSVNIVDKNGKVESVPFMEFYKQQSNRIPEGRRLLRR